MTRKSNNSFIGKLPPQAIEVEKQVLGTLIQFSEKIPTHVWNMFKPEIFYSDAHQNIANSIFNIHSQETQIDEMILMSDLKKSGNLELIGGFYYLTELTVKITNRDIRNIEVHLMVITEKYLSRELIRMSTEVINNSYDDSSSPLAEITKLAIRINELKNGIFKRTEKRIDDILDELESEMMRPKTDGLIGTSSGFRAVDYVCQGDQGNQLIIDAGRPGMGKTGFMCTAIVSQCFDNRTWELLPVNQQIPTACFSLEMSRVQLVFRMLSEVSSIPNKKLKKADLSSSEFQRYKDFKNLLKQAQIYIDDTGGLNIDEFEAKASVLVAVHGVKKIYIDYLQLMYGSPHKRYNSRESEVSDISRRLKQVAKNLNITIIASCQLSREIEKRKFCLPQLSDLRESGSIEQDADVVRAFWRPEYYEAVLKDLNDAGGSITAELFGVEITEFNGLMFCIILKCREEKTGKIPLRFEGAVMRVSDHKDVLEVLSNKQPYNTTDIFASQREAEF